MNWIYLWHNCTSSLCGVWRHVDVVSFSTWMDRWMDTTVLSAGMDRCHKVILHFFYRKSMLKSDDTFCGWVPTQPDNIISNLIGLCVANVTALDFENKHLGLVGDICFSYKQHLVITYALWFPIYLLWEVDMLIHSQATVVCSRADYVLPWLHDSLYIKRMIMWHAKLF